MFTGNVPKPRFIYKSCRINKKVGLHLYKQYFRRVKPWCTSAALIVIKYTWTMLHPNMITNFTDKEQEYWYGDWQRGPPIGLPITSLKGKVYPKAIYFVYSPPLPGLSMVAEKVFYQVGLGRVERLKNESISLETDFDGWMKDSAKVIKRLIKILNYC